MEPPGWILQQIPCFRRAPGFADVGFRSLGHGMALTGSLSNFRIGDILQTLWQNQTWGVLRVQSGNHRREFVVSPHGVALLDVCSIARARIEERLQHLGLIDARQLGQLRQKENTRRPLQEVLREVAPVDAKVLAGILESEAGEQVHLLLEWTDGNFEFLEGEPPGEITELRTQDTSSLVLEAARRQDERARFGDQFPGGEEYYIKEHEDGEIGTADATTIFQQIDGQSSLRGIADRSLGDLFSTAKIAAELEQAGWIRRLTWDELLILGDRLGKTDVEAARRVFDLAEQCREVPSSDALFDLAIRRTESGDKSGAALTLSRAASDFENAGDFERAADCIRQAIPLSPREAAVRRHLVDVLKKCGPERASEYYEALRDLLVVMADRGERENVAEIENEIMSRLPRSSEEEMRVGRALGLLGQRTTAAILLTRAAKSRGRSDAAGAIVLYREALQFAPENSDARCELQRLSQSRSTRRLRATLTIGAFLILCVGVAFPIRGVMRDQAEDARLKQAQLLAEKGEDKGALILLDQLEADTVGPSVLEKCQRLRDELNKKSDERRRVEENDTDDWIRRQFASAADAIDVKNYGLAVELYESILRRRIDEHRAELVGMRLDIIGSKLLFESRRVQEMCRSLMKCSQINVLSEPGSVRELRNLSSPERVRGLESILARIADTPLAKVTKNQDSLRMYIQQDIDQLTAARKEIELFETRLADTKELRNLENTLLDARNAEAEGNPRAAVKSFVQLQTDYKGKALKSYFDERARHWTAVVRQMEIVEKASTGQDTAAAEAEFARLKLLDPNVRYERELDIPCSITSIPAGARIRCNGREIGKTPMECSLSKYFGATLEFDLEGFESDKTRLDHLFSRIVNINLRPRAVWTGKLAGAPAGAGTVSGNAWFLADRSGSVRALDCESGNEKWNKKLDTLGGCVGNPAVSGDRVFVLTREGVLSALSQKTGESAGSVKLTGADFQFPPLLLDSSTMAVCETTNGIAMIDLNTMTKRRQIPLPGRATAFANIGRGRAAAGLQSGALAIADGNGALQTYNSAISGSIDSISNFNDTQIILVGAGQAKWFDADAKESKPIAGSGGADKFKIHVDGPTAWIALGGELQKAVSGERAQTSHRNGGSAAISDFLIGSGMFAIADSTGIAAFDAAGTPRWRIPSYSGAIFVQLNTGCWGVVSEGGEIAVFTSAR
ncbi:MAG: DUF4388 domain-containing protein [Planctomycetes bacterium]|nr:DUF4388 domain-containing protein [Planctomycetota bacterium]